MTKKHDEPEPEPKRSHHRHAEEPPVEEAPKRSHHAKPHVDAPPVVPEVPDEKWPAVPPAHDVPPWEATPPVMGTNEATAPMAAPMADPELPALSTPTAAVAEPVAPVTATLPRLASENERATPGTARFKVGCRGVPANNLYILVARDWDQADADAADEAAETAAREFYLETTGLADLGKSIVASGQPYTPPLLSVVALPD